MMTDPISIREIIAELSACDGGAEVYFDFPSFQRPTEVSSYRGYYDRPALGYTRGAETTVQALIGNLRTAISGTSFQGWKGGEFTYGGDQPLFVANPGETSDVLVVNVTDEGWRVVLRTSYVQDYY